MRSQMSEESNDKQMTYIRIQNFTSIIMKSRTLTSAQKRDILVKARRGDVDGAIADYDEALSANGVTRREQKDGARTSIY